MLTQNRARVCYIPIALSSRCPLESPGHLFLKKIPRPNPRAMDLLGSKAGSEQPTQPLCFKDFTGNSNGQLGLRITDMRFHCDMRRQAGKTASSLVSTTTLLSLKAVVLQWSPNQQHPHNPAISPPGDSDAC